MLILITGVSRGLGRALADWYIAHGHTVVGCARSGTEIFDLRFTYSEPHSFESLDVTEAIKVEIWSERVLGTHGVPDLLINNAAVVNEPAPLWTVPVQEFSKLIDINIKGVSNTIRAFVPHMIGRGSGRVGQVRLRGHGTVLCEQIRDRGAHQGLVRRASRPAGGGASQSRHYRHGHAQEVLEGRGGAVSVAQGLG